MLQEHLEAELEDLTEERADVIRHFRERSDDEDWMGAEDALSDLREIDAKLDLVNALLLKVAA